MYSLNIKKNAKWKIVVLLISILLAVIAQFFIKTRQTNKSSNTIVNIKYMHTGYLVS